MNAARFSHYVLRTTDVEAASAFYEAAIGRKGDGITPLPQAAVARGAPPHWLGHVDVGGLGGAESAAARFVARGAMRLGPPGGAGKAVVLRDPGGAVLALTSAAADASAAEVAWHQLNTSAEATAAKNYAELLGWAIGDSVDLGEHGRHRPFAFGAQEPNVGVLSALEGRAGVHPHWLFFFSVPSLDPAIERVRLHGGLVIGSLRLPNGARIAACDDPQGAAFGLIEPGDAASLASQ